MRKFIRAFRQARLYNAKFGGSFIFWEDYWKTWKAVPNPKKPKYNELYQFTNSDYLDYTT